MWMKTWLVNYWLVFTQVAAATAKNVCFEVYFQKFDNFCDEPKFCGLAPFRVMHID